MSATSTTLRRAPEQRDPQVAENVTPRKTPRPKVLIALSLLVVGVLAMPIAFLLIEAQGTGVSSVAHLIWRSLTATLLWNTVRLTIVVTLLCAVIGTLAAYGVERTDLPGRHLWAVLVVIPFAIPDFVVSFGWSSLSTWVAGFRGAVLVMTLAVYPLVYLPVAASLRGSDPAQEEIARSLGASQLATFFRVTLGQARRAILGGSLLVALVILAEYGAFEILGYQTFTTEIFSEFHIGFDTASACALSLVLVVFSLVVLGGEGTARGGGRVSRGGPGAQRPPVRRRLGRAKLPVLAAYMLLVAAGLGVPVGSSIYWVFEGGAHALSGVSLGGATLYTASYSGAAALLSTLMALPVALFVVRRAGRMAKLLERATFLVLGMPGLVVALALSYFSEQHLGGFAYQSAPMLIFAYALLFFPLALVGVRASVAQAPVALEEAASSLGVTKARVLWRVTLPLIAPGLGAAFCLVFLSAVTELTATLILIPTNVQTLATQFWAYQQNLSYGQAAPFALVIIAIAAVPSYLLGRFFDRLPSRGGECIDVECHNVINLSVTGLYKSYGTQSVLRGLNLGVAGGSFTSVLGPSGSGKTTMLRVIAGFERADRGEIRIGGEIVDDGNHYVAPDRRRIGYVPQDGSLFPHLSVDHNVGFGLPRRERRPAKIAELLELVGLSGLGGRYPHQLSGGQQQRVALARALAIDPAMLLLDEPFSSLDASLRASVRQDVRRVLQSAGATVVLVTHDQDEALSLSDHVAVIAGGRIGQFDTPLNLYTRPLSPALARGFGETNFVHGTLHNGLVATPLGSLTLEEGAGQGSAVGPEASPYLVLIRPEQLAISEDLEESGSTAHVVDAEFYGHDAVVRLRGDWAESPTLISRITDARRIPPPGTTVALAVRGHVVAWKEGTEDQGADVLAESGANVSS